MIPPDPEEPPASPLIPDAAEPDTVPGGDPVPREVRERTVHTAALSNTLIAVFNWSFRIGAALLLVGLVLMFIQGDGLAAVMPAPGGVLDLALAGRASAIVYLALLAFMVAPVLAVIICIVGFLRLDDRRYAWISTLVLLVLAASIVLALSRG